ncbi:MAG: sensor histidine kinase, partial [Vallitaleaceae bacterium]|nr:sensor histidine kinase [Vallitaleaceae bacterium]
NDGEILGVILVDLNFSLIEDMVSRISLGERGYIFIVDEFGELIYHPKRELIYNNLREEAFEAILSSSKSVIPLEVDNEKVEYIISSSKYSNWKVVGKGYVEDLNIHRSTLGYYFMVLIITAFVVSILLVSIVAVRILHPIKNLLKGMATFQSGQLDTQVQVENSNELGILTSTFNQMTRRIKALVEKMQQVEVNKRKSDLDALQAQINPHFLYNTLDSIVWMSEAGKKEEVVKMTSSLAKLFRISINKGEEYIRVAKEVEHVESYLLIQQMRYGDKLSYKIQVDHEIFQQRMIKIVLQPIVENAIYHGIKTLPGKGIIQIRGRGEGDFLIFEVEDNGMGMDEETKAKLLSGKIMSSSKGSGVGVYNVDQRIKLYYGRQYGLKIESELYEGTKVLIRLPMFTGEHYEKN